MYTHRRSCVAKEYRSHDQYKLHLKFIFSSRYSSARHRTSTQTSNSPSTLSYILSCFSIPCTCYIQSEPAQWPPQQLQRQHPSNFAPSTAPSSANSLSAQPAPHPLSANGCTKSSLPQLNNSKDKGKQVPQQITYAGRSKRVNNSCNSRRRRGCMLCCLIGIIPGWRWMMKRGLG